MSEILSPLQHFITLFEMESALNGSFRNKLGKAELLFLEYVWGPAFGDNFEGLKAEYPFIDHKGGRRFCDFVYIKNNIRLVIEIDGFTTHARDISPAEFNDHLARQNDLVLSGWLVLRFSAWQVENHPERCQNQIKQAIGHWWVLTQLRDKKHPTKLWEHRKQLIVQYAIQNEGKLKPSSIAKEFQISNRSAIDWLHRFEAQGLFSRLPSEQRTRFYTLTNYHR